MPEPSKHSYSHRIGLWVGVLWVVLLTVGLWVSPQLMASFEQAYSPPSLQMMVPRVLNIGAETPVWFHLFHAQGQQPNTPHALDLVLENTAGESLFHTQGATDIHGMWRLDLPALSQLQALRLKLRYIQPKRESRLLLDLPLRTEPPVWWQMHTDKPSYYPGETVYIVGVGSSKHFHLVSHQHLQLQILGPQGLQLRLPVKSTAQGDMQTAFRLTQDVPVGTYKLLLVQSSNHVSKAISSQSFEVIHRQQIEPSVDSLVVVPLTTALLPGLTQPLRMAVYYPNGQPVSKGWMRCFEQTVSIQNGVAEFTLKPPHQTLERIPFYASDEKGQLKQGQLALPIAEAGWSAEPVDVKPTSAGFVQLKVALNRAQDHLFYAFGQGSHLIYQGQQPLKQGNNGVTVACPLPCVLSDKWLRLHTASRPDVVRWFALNHLVTLSPSKQPVYFKSAIRVGVPLKLELIQASLPFVPDGMVFMHHDRAWPLLPFQFQAHRYWFHPPLPWIHTGRHPVFPFILGAFLTVMAAWAVGLPLWLFRYSQKVAWQPAGHVLRDAHHLVRTAEWMGFGLLVAVWLLLGTKQVSPLLWLVLFPPLFVQSWGLKKQWYLLRLAHINMPALLLTLWLVTIGSILAICLALPALLPAWLLGLTVIWWLWAMGLRQKIFSALLWRQTDRHYWLLSMISVTLVMVLWLWRQPVEIPTQNVQTDASSVQLNLDSVQHTVRETAAAAHLFTYRPDVKPLLPQTLPAPETPGFHQIQMMAFNRQMGLYVLQIPFWVTPDVYCRWDLPAYAMRNDHLDLPVNCYNPLDKPQSLAVQLESLELPIRSIQPFGAVRLKAPWQFQHTGTQTLHLGYRRHGEMVQIPRRIYVPDTTSPRQTAAIHLQIKYPRTTELVQGEEIPVIVDVRHHAAHPTALGMQLGIPSGYELLLDTLLTKAGQRSFSQIRNKTGYLEILTKPLPPHQPLRFHFQLRNMIPGKVRVPPALVWLLAHPEQLLVQPSDVVFSSKG